MDSSTDRFWVKMLSTPCIDVFEQVAHFFCLGSQTVVNGGNSPNASSKIFEESVSCKFLTKEWNSAYKPL